MTSNPTWGYAGPVFPRQILDPEVAERAFADLVELERERDLGRGTVQVAEELVHILRVRAVVLPVNLVGVMVPGVHAAVHAFADLRIDQHVQQRLPGTVFRAVDGARDAGPLHDVAGDLAVDQDVPVGLRDEVVHVRHHLDWASHGQHLGVVRAVLHAVHGRVHVVAHHDPHHERRDVVGLDVFQAVDLRHHVILGVVLHEPQGLGRGVLRAAGRGLSGQSRRQNGEREQRDATGEFEHDSLLLVSGISIERINRDALLICCHAAGF